MEAHGTVFLIKKYPNSFKYIFPLMICVGGIYEIIIYELSCFDAR